MNYQVLYSCPQCRAVDRPVDVQARESELDMIEWMNMVMIAVGADHCPAFLFCANVQSQVADAQGCRLHRSGSKAMSDDTSPSPLSDTVPAALTSSRGPIFERGDIVRHVRSMRLYSILQAPPYAVDENTGAPVYVYTAAIGAHPDPRWWVRPMWEMEETNRFVLHRKYRII